MVRGNRSFWWLTASQALGAFNDNAFRQFILLLALSLGTTIQLPLGLDAQAIAMGIFASAFVLLALLGGSLADRFSKRRVIVGMNLVEVFAMLLGFFALASASWISTQAAVYASLVVLFVMGSQSALFGPSKYGILPELVPEEDLTRANGIISMTTQLGIVGGMVIAGGLIELLRIGSEEGLRFPVHYAGFFFVTVATIGFACSLGVRKVPAADPTRKLELGIHRVPIHAVREFRWLAQDRQLLVAIVASSWYWLIAGLSVPALNAYGSEVLGRLSSGSTLFFWVAIGIATGSLLTSRLSKSSIELGLIPIGALIMACGFSAIYWIDALMVTVDSFQFISLFLPLEQILACGLLFLAGIGGGLYVVPLLAFIQQRPSKEEKGRVTGIHELANFCFILISAAVYQVLAGSSLLDLRPQQVMIAVAALTLFGSAAIFFCIPHLAVRLTLWSLIHSIYRITVLNPERIPKSGGALIVANHVSYADPFLVGASMPRYVRYLIHRDLMKVRVVGFFARMMRAIPGASTDKPREILKSLDEAGKAVAEGDLTCIFAEGGISRTGNLLPFSRGLERVAKTAEVPVIPVYLGRVWGSIFSFRGGKFFFKRPLKLPYPVTVAIGEPLPPGSSAAQVRRAVQELSVEVLESRRQEGRTLATEFFEMAKRRGGHPAIVEHQKDPISYRKLLIATLLLRRKWQDQLADQTDVGVLLPAGAGGAIVNLTLAILGKTSVNLNFTAGKQNLRSAIEQTGLKTIITADAFLSKLDLNRSEFAEDLNWVDLPTTLKSSTTGEKVRAKLQSLLPKSRLVRLSGVPQDPDAVATVVFSSGSTGDPKGVMLTHHNILSNVRSVSQVFDPRRDDRVVGVLPFFHSFGYAVTIWFPFLGGITAIYHPNPMDVKVIADLLREQHGTIFLSTPTFYRSYLRRFEREDFASVRLAVCGAEKLKSSLAQEWEEKFGVAIMEGYGCTELSPVVSVNLPDVVRPGVRQQGQKLGTIGHPLPGVVPKVVDPETFADLEVGEEGLLLIKGPNVMKGYLGRPKETAKVIRDGWYVTGDIARLDADGFITITDRLSRFSKLGGEMVPHILVEEKLQEVVDQAMREATSSQSENLPPQVAVTSIPDEAKGEKLVVVHTPLPLEIEDLLSEVGAKELPKLWLPRRDAFVEVAEVPKLGSGKLDLKAVRSIALDHFDLSPK